MNRHLTLVYRDRLTRPQKTAIGRAFFVNSGKNLVDIARFKNRFHTEIRPLVTPEGLEHFDRAYKAGKGVIGVTGHIGNFELLAVYVASLGYDIAVIGREMYDTRINRLLVESRETHGLTNIATTDSPRRAVSWLNQGKVLGVLIDTDSIRVRSMFIPAFGRLSNTPVGQTILGLRTGAAFVPLACVRTDDNRYRLIAKPQVSYVTSGDDDRDVYEVTRRCTEALEEIIDQYKDQWIWLHNRWHTRPRGTAE
jgi:KDO2-lipid IV(A) lauroyltransferase